MTLPSLPRNIELEKTCGFEALHYAEALAYGQACWEAALKEAAKACDAIGVDQRALYKGRAPYFGTEPGRANPYVDGKSDGAWECEDAVRALK